jgi:hypothetical protein
MFAAMFGVLPLYKFYKCPDNKLNKELLTDAKNQQGKFEILEDGPMLIL